jgi:hypothetical protein
MISIETIPIQLKINSSGSINTGRYFSQNDNGVGKLVFTVTREDGSEINYSELSEVYITLKFQDATYMEPCLCILNSDSITYELCNESLSKSGSVTGLIKLYTASGQIVTSNIFRFVVLADMMNGCTLSNEDKVSVVSDLISKLSNISFEEDEREASEIDRVFQESERVSSENIRIASEDTRQEKETQRTVNEGVRTINESTRQSNESTRTSEFSDMKEEYVSLIAILKDSTNQMIVFDIPSFSNPPDIAIHRILFTAPDGYTCTITGIKIISNGDSIGIDDVNTSNLQLIEGSDIISDTTFTDLELFPTKNETKDLVIIDGLIDKDDDVYIKVVNGEGVTTPNFSLQLNYDIEKI